MPYEMMTNHPDCKGVAVVKQGADELMGCHATRAEAEKQMAALYATEPDMMQARSRADDGFDIRSSDSWPDAELRAEGDDDHMTLDGFAAMFDSPSRLLSIADLSQPESRSQLAKFGTRTFREVVHPGAFRKTLSEQPDITLHIQHNIATLPLARTTAGTMTLAETRGLATHADLPNNEWGRPARDAVRRGDITGMSFRMGKVIDRWASETIGDYSGPVRHLHEVRLQREISLVTAPAYAETSATIRQLAEDADVPPDLLAEAFDVIRTPDAHLSTEQRDALMTAIWTKSEPDYVSPKLAQMQARLASAFAGK